jgi:two-component system CheB/CheR fusion protein
LWNQTLAQWTGQDCSDVVGHCLLDLFPELNVAGHRQPIERVFESGDPIEFVGPQHEHFIPARPVGEERYQPNAADSSNQLMVQRTSVRRHSADSSHVLLILEDVTAEHRQATALRQQQKQIEALSRQVASSTWEHTEFIAKLSHELRLPLNSMFGYGEYLREQENAPGSRAALEGLRRNGEKLVTVINDVLDYTKIKAQQVRIERTSFELKPLLREIVSLVHLTAADSGNQFTFEYDPKIPPTIASDSTRLRQILLNLLTNAVTFTEGGTVKLSVSWQPSEAGDMLEFQVSDTGIGLDGQSMQQLFQPFQQHDGSKNAKRKQGTGLGLAISHRLAELLGGQLTAISEPQRGSTFTLKLPVGE